jgi:hypothetical protein
MVQNLKEHITLQGYIVVDGILYLTGLAEYDTIWTNS